MAAVKQTLRTIATLLLCAASTTAQNLTVGLQVNEPGSYVGYTLFAPMSATTTYLIDHDGQQVHSWASDAPPGLSAYLLENGDLLRPASLGRHPRFTGGGGAGRVDRFDWDGNLLWQFTYSTDDHHAHHDVARLPNGNVLIIAWELRTDVEAIDAGRDPGKLPDGQLWPERIIEVEPTLPTGGNIVWQWQVWDHLVQDFDATKANFGVVADFPELVDINATPGGGPGANGADWLHINGIDYNPAFDQILLSVHDLSEVWVIDHSTTTAEAAGHTGGRYGRGGDLLYRWGNPQVYGAGVAADQQLFVQHDARWIPASVPGQGNITVFNNGGGRPGGDHSSIEEIVPPVDVNGFYSLGPGPSYGPATPVWTYVAPTPSDFYATNISGAHRLPNGNTLICDGPAGTFFEVAPNGDVDWLYVNPVINGGVITQGDPSPTGNRVFRAHRYSVDDPGLVGRDLTPIDQVEPYPCSVPEALLYAVKRPTLEMSLQWDPACTTRYLRRSLDPWRVDVEIPFADSAATTLTIPLTVDELEFFAIE